MKAMKPAQKKVAHYAGKELVGRRIDRAVRRAESRKRNRKLTARQLLWKFKMAKAGLLPNKH